MNKKGIELSINFIIILILAIVIFIFGIAFFVNLITKLPPGDPQIDSALKTKIESGDLVASYPGTITLSRGKSGLMGIAIYNPELVTTSYTLDTQVSGANDISGAPIAGFASMVSLNPATDQTISVPSHEHRNKLYSISVKAQAKSGTYVITSKVNNPGYGSKVILVEVP